ncbi:MAG: thioredoxin family protein [Planctomycetota bacterium]|jgi:thioredoxin 1
MIVELKKENFEATVSDNGIVLVDCWASWCAACKTFSPIYQKVSSRYLEHVFGKLDSQAERALVDSLGVEQIPSLLVYRDGIMLFQQPGNFDEETLEDIVSQAESVDMDAVRAHVASEQSEAESG